MCIESSIFRSYALLQMLWMLHDCLFNTTPKMSFFWQHHAHQVPWMTMTNPFVPKHYLLFSYKHMICYSSIAFCCHVHIKRMNTLTYIGICINVWQDMLTGTNWVQLGTFRIRIMGTIWTMANPASLTYLYSDRQLTDSHYSKEQSTCSWLY